jgi:hypothetical protein
MVLGLFETGYLFNAAKGFFETTAVPFAMRIAWRCGWPDAMARGANAAWYLDDHDRSEDTDFLGVDWFEYADWPVDDVRKHSGVAREVGEVLAAGSVTPWEPGGISPSSTPLLCQVIEAEGGEYDSFGATPPS